MLTAITGTADVIAKPTLKAFRSGGQTFVTSSHRHLRGNLIDWLVVYRPYWTRPHFRHAQGEKHVEANTVMWSWYVRTT